MSKGRLLVRAASGFMSVVGGNEKRKRGEIRGGKKGWCLAAVGGGGSG